MGTTMNEREPRDFNAMPYQASFGFVAGILLLHPVSMALRRLFTPSVENGMPDVLGSAFLGTFIHSFTPNLLPTCIAYGVFGGAVAMVIGYYRMTARKQAVLIRTQNERLALLEQTNRRNTRFMVHDLKTHVGCILGFANLLLEQEDEERSHETEEAIRRIRRQALMVTGNIHELLHFTELQETGKLNKEETTAVNLLQLAIEVFSPLEPGSEVVIGERAKQCPPVCGDLPLLKRVLINLAANSLKHNTGDVHVLLDAESQADGSAILFTCTDNGSGIPPEIADSMFDEFRSSDSGKPDSTGLGLAFCKATVEAHGGKIWCDSSTENQTRFCFTVPVKQEKIQGE